MSCLRITKFKSYLNIENTIDHLIKLKMRWKVSLNSCSTRFKSSTSSLKVNSSADEICDETDFKTICKILANGNAEIEKKLKALHLEVAFMHIQNSNIPLNLTLSDYKSLLMWGSKAARYIYLSKLQTIRELMFRKINTSSDGKLSTDSNCTPVISLNSHNMLMIEESRLVQALNFSQNLIIDCDFPHFKDPDPKLCANQAMAFLKVILMNLRHIQPMNLQFCNVKMSDLTMQYLAGYLPELFNNTSLNSVTHKSYIELYPESELFYVVPGPCENNVVYNPNYKYVIGGCSGTLKHHVYIRSKLRSEMIKYGGLNFETDSSSITNFETIVAVILEMFHHNNLPKAVKQMILATN